MVVREYGKRLSECSVRPISGDTRTPLSSRVCVATGVPGGWSQRAVSAGKFVTFSSPWEC